MSDDGLLKLCLALASLALAAVVPLLRWVVVINNRAIETDARTRGLQKQMGERKGEINEVEEAVEARRQAHDKCREQIVVRLGDIDGKLELLQASVGRLLRMNGVKPTEE